MFNKIMDKSFLAQGKELEKQFKDKICNFSVEGRAATTKEDMFEHFDIEVKLRIDVKGMKKIHRSDVCAQDDLHWIELRNVRGELGWLYGNSHLIAFETKRFWILVETQILQQFIKSNVKKIFVDSPEKALYKIYQRNGRKDMIILVKTMDLICIANQIIYK